MGEAAERKVGSAKINSTIPTDSYVTIGLCSCHWSLLLSSLFVVTMNRPDI